MVPTPKNRQFESALPINKYWLLCIYNSYQAIRIIFSSMVVWEIYLKETESELDLND